MFLQPDKIRNQNRDVMISFFRSKDDNLLLLIGSMVYTILSCNSVSDELKSQIGFGKVSFEENEEE
jgi:hypothetical protein